MVRGESRCRRRSIGRIGLAGLVFALLLSWLAPTGVEAEDFRVTPPQPTLDRWMYPFNFDLGSRQRVPTFASFDYRFDTRDAELLLGWDTAGMVATNAGPGRYLVKRARVTLTAVAPSGDNRPFVYDPSYDSYVTYLTNQPGYVPDADPGRPVEIYGAGFRNGFTAETFLENSPFGPINSVTSSNISIGTRNAFAAMHDAQGGLIDIANHVGQLNPEWTNAPFEVRPWAVGLTTDAAPGDEVPDGAKVTFDLDLGDPLILGYLQEALHLGRLRLMVSSLSPAGQSTPGGIGIGGAGAYPQWSNKENILYDPPRLELEGTVVGDVDSDTDGLPDDWERFWFGNLDLAGDGDPDGDGADNRAEWRAGTDPGRASNVLRILSVSGWDTGAAILRFPVAASRAYEVEASVDLIRWTPVAGQLTYPERGVGQWLESEPAAGDSGPTRFLRLVARMP